KHLPTAFAALLEVSIGFCHLGDARDIRTASRVDPALDLMALDQLLRFLRVGLRTMPRCSRHEAFRTDRNLPLGAIGVSCRVNVRRGTETCRAGGDVNSV